MEWMYDLIPELCVYFAGLAAVVMYDRRCKNRDKRRRTGNSGQVAVDSGKERDETLLKRI